MIAVCKYTEGVNAREINSLFKCKANTRTRANWFKPVMDKFPWEIRRKVSNHWFNEILQQLSKRE